MLSEIFKKPKTESHSTANFPEEPLILGKVQLLSLPGSPGWEGQWEALIMRAEQEATALATAGVNGLIIENAHDAPYAQERLDTAGAIAMALLVNRLQQFTGLPVGLSVLRNDPETALAIAVNTKVSFIRLPLLTGALLTEDGVFNSRFHQLMQYKARLKTELPPLLVDISTRHTGLSVLSNHSSLDHLLALARALPTQIVALAFIVTDNDLTPQEVAQLKQATSREILVESKARPQEAEAYCQVADGLILDAGLRKNAANHSSSVPPIDIFRVEEVVNQLRRVMPLHEMDPDIFLQR
jgi:membrane complex biogenesis BtpA family protein